LKAATAINVNYVFYFFFGYIIQSEKIILNAIQFKDILGIGDDNVIFHCAFTSFTSEYLAKHVRSPYRFFPVTVSLLMGTPWAFKSQILAPRR
jgi:hypothetical protein